MGTGSKAGKPTGAGREAMEGKRAKGDKKKKEKEKNGREANGDLGDYDQYVMNSKETLHYYLCAATVLGMSCWLFFQNIFFALLLTFISIPIKKYHIKSLANRRKNRLADQFRDLLYSISASVAAGRQLGEALMEAEENLAMIYERTSPMLLELNRMGRRMREGRESVDSILQDFARRSRVEDIENFVEVCLICRKTGGDLESLVRKATQVIQDKMEIQREIRMLTAQKRLEVRLLTALPFLIVFFLRLTSPDYIAIMDHTAVGQALLGLSLIGIGISYGISMRLIHIRI